MASIGAERAGGYSAVAPGADRLAWYVLRLSGVTLVVLALGHILITHYLNVPADTTFSFVAKRWANPLWRTFDWLLLLAALWHGLIGLRYAIADYIRPAGWRTFAFSAAWIVGLVFTALGSVTIFTFDAAASEANSGPLADAHWIADVLGYSLFVFAIVTYVAAIALVVWVVRSLRAGGPPIYAGDPGMYAWALHRATGIGILFFLLVHIIDIMLIGLGRDVYNASVKFYSNPFLLPMEIALVGAVVYHTLNGLRIVAIDFWESGTRRERLLFWWVLGGAVLLTIPSAIAILVSKL